MTDGDKLANVCETWERAQILCQTIFVRLCFINVRLTIWVQQSDMLWEVFHGVRVQNKHLSPNAHSLKVGEKKFKKSVFMDRLPHLLR